MDFRPSAPSPTPSRTGRPLVPTPRPEPFGSAASHYSASSSPSRSSRRQSRFIVDEFEVPGFGHSSSNTTITVLPPSSRDDGLGFRAFSTPELPPEDEEYHTPVIPATRTMSASTGSFSIPKRLIFGQRGSPLEFEFKHAEGMNAGYSAPRWLTFTRFAFHVLSASGGALVVGLLAVSLHVYNTTKNRLAIHTQDEGFAPTWPSPTSLVPTGILMAAGLLASLNSTGSLVLGIFLPKLQARGQVQHLPWLGIREHYVTVCLGAMMALLWVLALIAFPIAGGVDSLAVVACRQKGSLSTLIVDYGSACGQQYAAWYFGIGLLIAEFLMLASYGLSFGLWKKWSSRQVDSMVWRA